MKRITKIEAAEAKSRKKLRVAAYARVSTDSDEQLVSLETQKQHYEAYIRSRRDWEYAGLYYDEGISGTKMAKRDGLLSLLADCEAGKIDYIVVKSISRFSRNTVDTIETVRYLTGLGIYIFFEKENIDTSKMEGELLLSILSSLAESESRSISDNSTWGIQKRFQNGSFKIVFTPYGYRYEDGLMVIDEEQAKTVRWIFSQVLSGVSCSKIARTLNEQGIPSKRNGRWESNVIAGMIKNEKYVGDALFQKTYTDDRFNRHTNRGEKAQYYMKDHHEAIISREDFDAANAIIERNGREKGIRRGETKYLNRYAFSGKIVCGECGSTFKRVMVNGTPCYSCSGHLKDKDSCSIKAIREDSVKAAFITMMNKLSFSRTKVLLPLAESMRGAGDKESLERLSEIISRLEEITKRRMQVAQFFSKGLIDPSVFAEESDALDLEEDRLTNEKKTLTCKVSGDRSQLESLELLLKDTAKRDSLTAFDDDLFLRHVDRIIVYERTEVGFAMKCGPVFRERI